MEEEKYIAELLEVLKQLNTNREQAMDHYKRRVFAFIKNISPQSFDSFHFENELEQMAVYPVILGALLLKKEFKRITEIVNESVSSYLMGSIRGYDYFVSLIIRFFYLAKKSQGQDSSTLFSLLVCNKELGNEHTISVITNCLLDMFISNKIFRRIGNTISTASEQAIYNYYNGMISMVEGEYESALKCFHTSAILASSRKLILIVEKCIIICMLQISDYSIPYPYRPKLKAYFELIAAVKKAEVEKFEEILENNKEEFLSQGLYFVAQRLAQNVIQEGMRKISLVYSRISYEDIAHLLNINLEEVEYLVRRTIKKGFIKGRVADGVFYSLREDRSAGNIGLSIRDCIHLTKSIQEHMKYPSIEPLCYEKIKESYEK